MKTFFILMGLLLPLCAEAQTLPENWEELANSSFVADNGDTVAVAKGGSRDLSSARKFALTNCEFQVFNYEDLIEKKITMSTTDIDEKVEKDGDYFVVYRAVRLNITAIEEEEESE